MKITIILAEHKENRENIKNNGYREHKEDHKKELILERKLGLRQNVRGVYMRAPWWKKCCSVHIELKESGSPDS